MTAAVLEAESARRVARGRQSSLFDDRPTGGSRREAAGPEARRAPEGPAESRRRAHPRPGGDRLTLEARLERIWEGLRAAGAAECPVCNGRLEQSGTGASCCRCRSRLE